MTPEERSARAQKAVLARWRVTRAPAPIYVNSPFEGAELDRAAAVLVERLSFAGARFSTDGMRLILTGKRVAPPMVWRQILRLLAPQEPEAIDPQELILAMREFGTKGDIE